MNYVSIFPFCSSFTSLEQALFSVVYLVVIPTQTLATGEGRKNVQWKPKLKWKRTSIICRNTIFTIAKHTESTALLQN